MFEKIQIIDQIEIWGAGGKGGTTCCGLINYSNRHKNLFHLYPKLYLSEVMAGTGLGTDELLVLVELFAP